MKQLYLPLLLITGTILFSKGQSLIPDVVASAGDIFTGKHSSLEWTLGEVTIETISSETSLLTQGFHQSYLQVLKVNAPEDPLVNVLVYPNPVNDLLTIEITTAEKNPQFKLELFDFVGQRMHDQVIETQTHKEQLDVSSFSSSFFVLRVINLRSHTTESFKIYKVKF
ncbi:MAG TPA: T9SS type A sorting domain-containing protein [Bacteroidales bacterium]|nr:T9SS type A sorting domain-containing protein [Bacteroidales bacterium]